MKKYLTILLLLTINILAAQNEEMLLKRVEALELRMSLLEQRLNEANTSTAAAPIKATKEECDKWKLIKIGMKISEVETILGKPTKIIDSPGILTHFYNSNNSIPSGMWSMNQGTINYTGKGGRAKVFQVATPNCPN